MALQMMLPMKHMAQKPVLTSRSLDCRLKMPRMWLVMWLLAERQASRRTSGGVFTLFSIMDLVTAMVGPSFTVAVALPAMELVNRPPPSWLLMAESASAKASECSKRVMPVSAATGRPCTAHETVSRNWHRQKVPNSGHSSDSEPRRSADRSSRSEGIMLTARHESRSDEPSSRWELKPCRKVLVCENMRSELLVALPHRISAKSGDVWHWIDCCSLRACTANRTKGRKRRTRRACHRSRSRRLGAANMCVLFSTTAMAMQHSAHLLVA